MTVHRPIAGALLSAALLLGACGGAGSQESGGGGQSPPAGAEEAGPPSGDAVATVQIRETDFKLDPASVRVKKPGKVRLELDNAGRTTHALEVEGPDGEVETEDIAAGGNDTLEADLNKAGTYTMYCPVGNHRELGMTGRIVVAGG